MFIPLPSHKNTGGEEKFFLKDFAVPWRVSALIRGLILGAALMIFGR
jgi:hypothetical protein